MERSALQDALLWQPVVQHEGMAGGRSGEAVGQQWDSSGAAVGQQWGSSGAAVGQQWGSSGAAVGQQWGSSGAAVGQTWGSSGAAVGQQWGSSGAAVGQQWGRPCLARRGRQAGPRWEGTAAWGSGMSVADGCTGGNVGDVGCCDGKGMGAEGNAARCRGAASRQGRVARGDRGLDGSALPRLLYRLLHRLLHRLLLPVVVAYGRMQKENALAVPAEAVRCGGSGDEEGVRVRSEGKGMCATWSKHRGWVAHGASTGDGWHMVQAQGMGGTWCKHAGHTGVWRKE
ncbi:unnamed protein product [Closterium sp. NIES-65]|nr:unnamed protein product [Closterium sp. NIES-65]